jgi:hypothetical protein
VSLSRHPGDYCRVALPDTDVGFYFGAMSTRPGTLTADDLTVSEQADALGTLIHDCELLPAGWRPDATAHLGRPFAPAVEIDDVVRRILALGDRDY